MKIKKDYVWLFCILLLASVLRFWALGQIPNGSTPDELNYIYGAYSILKTQNDIVGNHLPLSFHNVNSFSPVPIYLITPFLAIFDLSLFSGRLLFALTGILTIFLLYLIARILFKNNLIALFSAFVLAVSPWHVQLSRTAYECSLALFFYVLGTYVFLKGNATKKIYLSLPVFLLAFYTYHATKLFFFIYLPLLFILFVTDKLQRKKEIGVFFGGMVCIVLSFWLVSATQKVTRQEIFIWNNQQAIANEVNMEREHNTAPLILKTIFNNKALVVLKKIRENYLYAFSPEYLFLQGEQGFSAFLYNIGQRGMLYIIELPLLLVGIFSLSRIPKKERLFVILGLLLAPLPSAFTFDQSYGARSIMMLPFLSLLVGLGLYSIYEFSKKSNKKVFVTSFFVLFFLSYSVVMASYVYQYYFRYSIYAEKYWNSSQRDVVEYIAAQKNKYKQVIVAGDSGGLILYYGLFNTIHPTIIQQAYNSQFPRHIDNITFVEHCLNDTDGNFDPKVLLPKNTLYVAAGACYEDPGKAPPPIEVITWRDITIHIDYKIYKN